MKYYILILGFFILIPSVKSQSTYVNVDSLLSANPEIRSSILWTNRINTISYENWSPVMKQELQIAVDDLINSRTPFDLDGLPPVTQVDTYSLSISESTAWEYYIAYVAQSIVADIVNLVPWKLSELNETSLSVLFNSRSMIHFDFDCNEFSFVCVTPAPPDYTYRFLEDNALIGATRLETITRVIEWCKRLNHFIGRGDAENLYSTWQYYGAPPVIRTIEGTFYNDDIIRRHWTAGCHGTVNFMRSLLHTLNIPVEYINLGHALPYFVHEGLYLSHGDDPYCSTWRSSDVPIPASELLIRSAEYQEHFGSQLTYQERMNNFGYKPVELGVKYLSIRFCEDRCKANSLGYDNQQCYESMSDNCGLDRVYTMQDLIELDFWNRLDDKISNYGGCALNKNFIFDNEYWPPPSSEKSIVNIWFFGQYGETVIDNDSKTISAKLRPDFNLSNIIPHFSVSEKASIDHDSGTPVDFTIPKSFTVTAEDGTQEIWSVNIAFVTSYLMVEPPTRRISSDAGNALFRVYSNVNWSVSDDANWLSINPLSGNGNGIITANYSANTRATSRSAAITVSGTGQDSKDLTINQQFGIDTLSVTPSNIEVGPEAGSADFLIYSNTNWDIYAYSADWLSISPPLSGTGNFLLSVNYDSNTSGTRLGLLIITGEGVDTLLVRILQTGSDTLSAFPGNRNVSSQTGSTTFDITSNTSWFISTHSWWLSMEKYSGNGNATLTVHYESNQTVESRIGSFTITGPYLSPQTFTVTQEGVPAYLNTSSSTLSIGYQEGSTNTFNVTSNINWSSTNSETWLTHYPNNGSGDGTITLSAQKNPNTSSRTATISISGEAVATQTVIITQDGAPAVLNVSPTSLPIDYIGGETNSINIISNTDWVASCSENWLTVSSGSGTGDASILITAKENTTITARQCTITITGAGVPPTTVTITQESASPFLETSVTSLPLISEEGASGTFDITSNTSWTVSSSEPWLTAANTSGSANGTVTVTAQKNPTINTRNATVTINATGLADKTIIISQAGSPTGIMDFEGGQIRIYPNPASTILVIEGIIQEAQIIIFDIQGSLVLKREIDGTVIDISNLPSGVYSIVLESNNEIIKRKFVKVN